MTRIPFLALSWSFGAMLVLQAQVQAQAPDAPLPVSMERIRAGLTQPPSLLQVAPPSGDSPTFRIEVQARPFVMRPIDDTPFDPTFGLPSVGELVMDGLANIRSAAVDYKRRRAERRARNEVDSALAAFCAARECPPHDRVSAAR